MISMILNHIKTYREKLGMTQEQLASSASVSRQTIIAMEKGNYEPSLGLGLRLAKIFSAKGGSASGGKVKIEDIFMLK
jgi:putative transcriptional regulator